MFLSIFVSRKLNYGASYALFQYSFSLIPQLSVKRERFNDLSEYQKQKVMVMLSISPNLYTAHFMKEEFFKILDCKDHDKAKELLLEWMDYAKSSNLKRFQKCADTFFNWFSGILNSLNTPVTNGFTEGCNNKIKVLKRNAYGYKNFSRFRKRILHIFN